MNEKTIRRHLKEMDVFSDLKLKLKLMTEKSLITIGVKAAQGEGVGWSELPIHAKAMNGLRNPYAQPNGSR